MLRMAAVQFRLISRIAAVDVLAEPLRDPVLKMPLRDPVLKMLDNTLGSFWALLLLCFFERQAMKVMCL